MAYVIVEPCIGVKDSACVEVCAPDAIHEGEDQFYIDAYECMSCGVCKPECPVEAIYEDESLPEKWIGYIEKSRRFFMDDTLDVPDSEPEWLKELNKRRDSFYKKS